MASAINNPAWLEWMAGLMGGVSRQKHFAALPSDRFHCLLDDLPLQLLPRPRLAMQTRHGRDLILNPLCRLYAAPELPEELTVHEDLLSGFALQGTIAWVRDPSAGSLLPFWLGPQFRSVLSHVQPGEPVGDSVPASMKSVLQRTGIFVSASCADDERVARGEALSWAAELFQKKDYAPLCGLIHPFHIAALRRYYRYLIRTGQIPLGDGQSSRRYVAYNDPVARFFHQQIASTVSVIAGEPVKPSYVYLASYLSGAELKKHVDREQCEFSITLCLDYSPEPTLATPWPISLDTPSGQVTVYQALGDGLAYRGTRLPHYRSKLREGQTSTSIFFHYVAEDFSGCLD
jgi:hypothetical protein